MGVIAEKTWRKQAGLAISLKGLVTFKMEFHSLKSMSIFMLTILHFRENIAKVSMTHPALRRRGPITSSVQLFDTSHPPKQTPNLSKQERKPSSPSNFMGSSRKPTPQSNTICLRYMSGGERWPFYFLSTGMDYELQLLDDPFTQECQTDSRHINPFSSSSLRYPPNHLTAADVLLFIQNYN